MKVIRPLVTFVLLACCILSSGCTPTIPREALMLSPESMSLRQLQTRRFETTNEKELLIAAAGVVQDLGFNIDESESALGLIVGSKDRDATDTGQVIGAIFLSILTKSDVSVDKQQKIRASIVTRQAGKYTNMRITFQRTVWNTQNMITRAEALTDPKLYQEFFEKVSKAVFLEANSV